MEGPGRQGARQVRRQAMDTSSSTALLLHHQEEEEEGCVSCSGRRSASG